MKTLFYSAVALFCASALYHEFGFIHAAHFLDILATGATVLCVGEGFVIAIKWITDLNR